MAGDAPSRGGELERLVEESLGQTPSFDGVDSEDETKKTSLKSRLIGKLPAVSASVGNALLSIPNNPVYTPPAVAALTYLLSNSAFGLARKNRLAKGTAAAGKSESNYNQAFAYKLPLSMLSGAAAFGISAASSLYKMNASLGVGTGSFYLELAQQLPSLTPELAFGFANGLGAYAMLSGIERLMHSESLATLKQKSLRAIYGIAGNRSKTINCLEQMLRVHHSKKKEAAILLQLGDAYADAGMNAEATNTYKRMLMAAARKDDLTGVSDWLIRKHKSPQNNHSRTGNKPAEGIYGKIQEAMHEFANGNLESANSSLKDSAAAEPYNRQLRRIRALFFEATGNYQQANLEMRIYEGLLRQDPNMTFRALGESRNEVIVPNDETAGMPDIYIKRSKDMASLEEEVNNINAFSAELPGLLPRVVGQGFDGEYHYITIESLGTATMKQKAAAGMLTEADARATLDLLINVMVAGEKLEKEGRITVSRPIEAETYVYSARGLYPEEDVDAAQPNFTEDGSRLSLYFAHRVTDLFILTVKKLNGVEFSEEHAEKIRDGAFVLGEVYSQEPLLNRTYTDFTHGNIIFQSVAGNLNGKIDWEKTRSLPVMFELVNILEFYTHNFGHATQASLMEYFISRFEKAMHLRINRRAFNLIYHAAAVQRHLELVGYRSRDTAANPDNAKAQVYDHIMARMHLQTILNASPAIKQPLEQMLGALEEAPILKDKRQQGEIEAQVRSTIMTGIPYTLHEMRQKSFWSSMLFPAEPAVQHAKSLDKRFRYGMGTVLGIPATLGAIGAYTVLSFFAMQQIMPSMR